MGAVIDLTGWRREREPLTLRLEQAVMRLDDELEGQERADVPPWVVTEVLAIQGCISMELIEEAVQRCESLVRRWRKHVKSS